MNKQPSQMDIKISVLEEFITSNSGRAFFIKLASYINQVSQNSILFDDAIQELHIYALEMWTSDKFMTEENFSNIHYLKGHIRFFGLNFLKLKKNDARAIPSVASSSDNESEELGILEARNSNTYDPNPTYGDKRNGKSFAICPNTLEESIEVNDTICRIREFIEDMPDHNKTSEKRKEIMKALLAPDPEFFEFVQSNDNSYSNAATFEVCSIEEITSYLNVSRDTVSNTIRTVKQSLKNRSIL
jgi:hypothetical protein